MKHTKAQRAAKFVICSALHRHHRRSIAIFLLFPSIEVNRAHGAILNVFILESFYVYKFFHQICRMSTRSTAEIWKVKRKKIYLWFPITTRINFSFFFSFLLPFCCILFPLLLKIKNWKLIAPKHSHRWNILSLYFSLSFFFFFISDDLNFYLFFFSLHPTADDAEEFIIL